MSQPAKAQEPSMEEILASIRRIIADDDPSKAPPRPAPAPASVATPRPPTLPSRMAPPPPRPAPPPPAPSATMNQSDIDAMMAGMDAKPAAEPPPPDILELTEAMAEQSAAASFQTIDGQPDVVFADEPPPEPPRPAPVAEAPRPAAQPNGPVLMSNSTHAAVNSAFNSLAHTVLVQNARTLEDLVREMLRPLLKAWLDDNLPSMVERIVRAEIERVSRGRG